MEKMLQGWQLGILPRWVERFMELLSLGLQVDQLCRAGALTTPNLHCELNIENMLTFLQQQ